MASHNATHPTSVWSILRKGPLKILVLGGGNWGTTIGRVAAQNAESSYLFDTRVHMWLKEVQHEGRPLTETINTDHVNPVYLPGISLPHNLVAVPDLFPAASEADLIILVVPHQFVESTAHELAGRVKPTARALSLVKGISVQNGRWPLLPSELFSSVVGIPCMALSGANVANDIARGQFSETTLGYDPADPDAAALWVQLLDQPHFKVNAIPDICGVEASGALKNVVALAAGFCDALGYGTNTKAALIRLGAEEMKLFTYMFFSDVLEDTYFDSAGFADLITTCFGGRNVRCAQEFVRREGKDDWTVIENDLLAGQKMQGQLTCHEVYQVIRAHQLQNVMRLFTTIYKIAFERLHPSQLLSAFAVPVMRPIKRITECTPCTIPDALKRQRDIIQQKKQREHHV